MDHSWVPAFPGFKVLRTLGIGTFSTVLLAENEITKDRIAMKVVARSEPQSLVEYELLREIEFPFITKLYGYSVNDKYIAFAMEYSSEGSLLDLIQKYKSVPLESIRDICGQVVMALRFLHEKGICHRDIKAENILFDSWMNIKLIDFGFAGYLNEEVVQCGSANYIAPEVISGGKSSFECDIWSLGIVLYCCAVGKFPFYDSNTTNLMKQIEQNEPTYPDWMDSELKDLIQKMLKKDPDERIELEDVMNHAFLREFDFVKLDEIIKNTSTDEEITDIVTMNKRRMEDIARYRRFGVIEKTDKMRIEKAVMENRLMQITPLQVIGSKQIAASLARKIAGKNKRSYT